MTLARTVKTAKRLVRAAAPRKARRSFTVLKRAAFGSKPSSKGHGTVRANSSLTDRSRQHVSAPIVRGIVTRNVSRGSFIYPFNSATLGLGADAGSVAVIGVAGTTIASGIVDINPAYGSNINGMLGPTILNLSKSFDRYRLRNVRVTYEPAVAGGTTAAGTFALGRSGDPFTSFVNNYENVSCIPGALTFPVWREVTLPSFSTDWLYVRSNGTSGSDQRIAYAGSLAVAARGLALPSTNYGTLRLKGDIEFCDPIGSISTTSEANGQPVFTAFQLDNLATAAVPFGPAGVVSPNYSITGALPPGVTIDGTTISSLSRVIFRIELLWTTTTGVIVAAASVTAVTRAAVISSSASGAPPYSCSFTLAFNGTSTSAATATFAGPTGMATGDCRVLITPLPDTYLLDATTQTLAAVRLDSSSSSPSPRLPAARCAHPSSDDPFDHLNDCAGPCHEAAIVSVSSRRSGGSDTPHGMERSIHLTKDMVAAILRK